MPIRLPARRIGATLVPCDSFAAPHVQEVLRAKPPDAGFHTGSAPLRPGVLALCGQGVMRCHVGALPQVRGSDGLAWSLLRAEPCALSCLWLDGGTDTGAVLLRCPVPYSPGDTLERLRARIEPLRVEALRDVARGLRGGTLMGEAQAWEAGRQHYPMHPRLAALAALRRPR